MLNNIGYIIQYSPRLLLFIIALIFAGTLVWGVNEDMFHFKAENDTYWREKLECRKSGGSFEYFGSEGYHCIKQKGSE